jgi:hypothetical protein
MLGGWTVAVKMMIDAYIQPLVMRILKHPVFFVFSHHCVVFVNVCFCLFLVIRLLIYSGPLMDRLLSFHSSL